MVTELEIVVRLAVAALLGSLIGFERERLMWTAGVRTHMLVSVGACLFMIVSAYGFEAALRMDHVSLDPSRIAAQVVSGIGFLGAGAILMKGQVIRGLTTAASIWSVAAIGLAAGGGLFFAAVVTTLLILFILVGIKPLETAYHARVQNCVLRIRSEHGALEVDMLKSCLKVHGGQIRRIETRQDGEIDETTVQLIRVSTHDVKLGAIRLKGRAGIHQVDILRKQRGAPALED